MKKHSSKLFYLLSSIICLLITQVASAQNTISDSANDFLRQSNKLYVVISILVTIFAGIIIFLILQERKISKLEQQLKDKHP